MTGPQRVSDADRERVVDVLRLRCAEGYLSLDTLSGRVEAAYRAKTSAQLEAVILDLPRRMRAQVRGSWTSAASSVTRWLGCAPEPRAGLLEVSSEESGAGGVGRFVVGRSWDCDVRLADPSVSRRHAELRHGAAGWSIEDLASLNGVLVNGRRIWRAAVESGDHLTLGDAAVTFRSRD